MSIFKSNKFFRIIKHFVLTIPLMFVLGTSIYTIVNPNAKDSYYGESINEEQIIFVNRNSDLVIGNTYRFQTTNDFDWSSAIGGGDNRLIFENIRDIILVGSTIDLSNVNALSLYREGSPLNENYRLVFYTMPNIQVASVSMSLNGTSSFGFTFELVNSTLGDISFLNFSNFLSYISYNQFSYLSNAFEYGMYQFNQVGFNKFDFVGLFDGIFTDNIHNVYTDFINSYINYYLMIECVYFAPWVIHAFIHFAYDLGDYFTLSFRRKKGDDD